MKTTESIEVFAARFCIRCGIPTDHRATAMTTKFNTFEFAVCSPCFRLPALQPGPEDAKPFGKHISSHLLSFWASRDAN